MKIRKPHYEIVETDAEQPWFARFIGTNGEEVWRTSENYVRKIDALQAVRLLHSYRRRIVMSAPYVRTVDERGL